MGGDAVNELINVAVQSGLLRLECASTESRVQLACDLAVHIGVALRGNAWLRLSDFLEPCLDKCLAVADSAGVDVLRKLSGVSDQMREMRTAKFFLLTVVGLGAREDKLVWRDTDDRAILLKQLLAGHWVSAREPACQKLTHQYLPDEPSFQGASACLTDHLTP